MSTEHTTTGVADAVQALLGLSLLDRQLAIQLAESLGNHPVQRPALKRTGTMAAGNGGSVAAPAKKKRHRRTKAEMAAARAAEAAAKAAGTAASTPESSSNLAPQPEPQEVVETTDGTRVVS